MVLGSFEISSHLMALCPYPTMREVIDARRAEKRDEGERSTMDQISRCVRFGGNRKLEYLRGDEWGATSVAVTVKEVM